MINSAKKRRRIIALGLGLCGVCCKRKKIGDITLCGYCQEQQEDARRRLLERRRDALQCIDCGLAADGRWRCSVCSAKFNTSQRLRRATALAACRAAMEVPD